MSKMLDGKKIKEEIIEELKLTLSQKTTNQRIYFVSIGADSVTKNYLGQKIKLALQLSIETETIELSPLASQEDLKTEIEKLVGHTKKGDGIVIQLPLPSHLDKQKILNLIPKELDIDVLNVETYQDFLSRTTQFVPPVARAVWRLLSETQQDFQTKKIVVVGFGQLVGRPVVDLLRLNSLESVVLDINTLDLVNSLKEADVIISGIGQPHMIKPEMIKDGALLIDVGTSELGGQLVGDIDPACYEKASYYSPVPGGVGPVAVASLYANLILGY